MAVLVKPSRNRLSAIIRGLLALILIGLIVWGTMRQPGPPPPGLVGGPRAFADRAARRVLPHIPPRTPPRRTPLPTAIPREVPARPDALTPIGATEYHAQGHTGAGVVVAVIDTDFAGWDTLVRAGALPADLVTRRFAADGTQHATLLPGESAHGSACAEIIHAIAPDARLYLVQVSDLRRDLGPALDYLQGENARVVSTALSALNVAPADDAIYAHLAAARAQGMLIVQSAGNYARQHITARFTDRAGDGWHEFGETWHGQTIDALGLPVRAGQEIRFTLHWDAPDARLALHLYDETGTEVARTAQPPQSSARANLAFTPPASARYTLRIRHERVAPSAPQFTLFVSGGRYPLESAQVAEGSLTPPADSPDVLTVGAARLGLDVLAEYSSRGPTADGRIKPDLVSYAHVGVTAPGYDAYGFLGTSAATPHVAGMAALLLGLPDNAALDPAGLTAELARFASDRGAPGKDNVWGYGLAQLPPLGVRLTLIAPSTAAPLWVAPDADTAKTRLELDARRSDGSPLLGLGPAAFEVRVAGVAGEVLTARSIGARYVLDVLLPIPPGDRAALTVRVHEDAVSAPGVIRRAADATAATALPLAPTLDVLVYGMEYRVGDPLLLLASLTDARPIPHARVTLRIRGPGDIRHTQVLHDDGQHRDGVAGNGVYGGMYTRARQPGEYHLALQATGQTAAGEAFALTWQQTYAIAPNPIDSDSDGMPDSWEILYGLNPAVHDAHDDPDNDGLTNLEEYLHGSDPHNWDTDGDGLSDGAEVTGHYVTDPTNVDTDLGGVNDGDELRNRTNPLDGTDDFRDRHIVYLPVRLRD